jgi:branched-subunit amino acid aminotransferase/4-amino-4-deoxychorismate lyase
MADDDKAKFGRDLKTVYRVYETYENLFHIRENLGRLKHSSLELVLSVGAAAILLLFGWLL